MNGDLERQREEADRRGEESDRRMQMHDFERFTARHLPDPLRVLRLRLPDGSYCRAACRWSLAARLARDAAALGRAGDVTVIGEAAAETLPGIGPGDLVILRDQASEPDPGDD